MSASIKNEAYVESIGGSCLLLRRDGEGQVPLMGIFDDDTLTLYDRDNSHELDCAIQSGLKRIGYGAKFKPANLGSSILYLLEHNGIETR